MLRWACIATYEPVCVLGAQLTPSLSLYKHVTTTHCRPTLTVGCWTYSLQAPYDRVLLLTHINSNTSLQRNPSTGKHGTPPLTEPTTLTVTSLVRHSSFHATLKHSLNLICSSASIIFMRHLWLYTVPQSDTLHAEIDHLHNILGNRKLFCRRTAYPIHCNVIRCLWPCFTCDHDPAWPGAHL